MLFKTEGIVLHTVRYGETSVIVRIFTELFGIQSYLVNGVRTSNKKKGRANLLQPAHILNMVVYHREQKNLQRISEFKPAYLYRHLYTNMIKNTIALYVSELLYKGLAEPEPHPSLFHFVKKMLQWMDQQPASRQVLLPLYFTLKMAGFLGFKIYGHYSATTPFVDLKEGSFVSEQPASFFLENTESQYTGKLMEVEHPDELRSLQIPASTRSNLLNAYLGFLKFHLPNFHDLHSPEILREVLRGG